ncbi:MAG: hypothetical protein QM758_18060 [Armatimonas sp.]
MSDLNAAESKQRTEAALNALKTDKESEMRAAVEAALTFLVEQVNTLRAKANGYPANPIQADVWMDGAALATHGAALTEALHETDWTEAELTAAQCWASATLAVQSHYRNLVGPAMLAMAGPAERLGDVTQAAGLYDAVIKDFEDLIDTYEGETAPLSEEDEDRVALESLKTALERRLVIYPNETERRAQLERLLPILAR